MPSFPGFFAVYKNKKRHEEDWFPAFTPSWRYMFSGF
uniref:Uncharacterized protein n=1 Tax=uncultured Desulfobacterium sp. TaxID=201089 RepID=E1YMP5_9BACT|nr:unknown protein [uncultured Desulfobacterium sp.]